MDHGKCLSPGVGSIEGQTFPVREAQTTCLRFDLTLSPHVVPNPWSSSVREPSFPVFAAVGLPQTRLIISAKPSDARGFLEAVGDSSKREKMLEQNEKVVFIED
jgi:hypothetical protein